MARDSFLSGETKCFVLRSLLGFILTKILIVDPPDQELVVNKHHSTHHRRFFLLSGMAGPGKLCAT